MQLDDPEDSPGSTADDAPFSEKEEQSPTITPEAFKCLQTEVCNLQTLWFGFSLSYFPIHFAFPVWCPYPPPPKSITF